MKAAAHTFIVDVHKIGGAAVVVFLLALLIRHMNGALVRCFYIRRGKLGPMVRTKTVPPVRCLPWRQKCQWAYVIKSHNIILFSQRIIATGI